MRTETDRYIHEQNLILYRKVLSETKDQTKRQTVLDLLADEQAKRATGEDRRVLLTGLLDDAWLLEAEAPEPGEDAPELLGFLISILPESATLVAPDPDDAICLLELLRYRASGRARVARAIVVDSHRAGMAALAANGWSQLFETPRMLRGPAVDWDPTMIWSLLSFGLG